MDLVIRNAEVDGRPGVDVCVSDGLVTAAAPGAAERGEAARTIDARGGAVIPGLHDHHIHLRSLAAALTSVRAGPPDVTDRQALAHALRAAPTESTRWIRAIGYHDSVAGPLDRFVLDEIVRDRPVRVQHRSGALWVLNTAAIEATNLNTVTASGVELAADGLPTGRLWRMDEWLATAVASTAAAAEQRGALDALSRSAAAMGITGFTDANPHRTQADADSLAAAAADGTIRQRLHLMAPVGVDVSALDQSNRVTRGPVKVMLDDTTLPPLDDLVATVGEAHRAGQPVAVHCVTQLQLVVTLAAIDAAGAHRGDRIEHAAVVPPDLIDEIARLGLTVVTQPNFIAERGEQYLDDVDGDELDSLYRLCSLTDAGIALAAGTDAPFGRPDPWFAMRAAVERRIGPKETLDARRALDLFLGRADAPATRRRIARGEAADLCVLNGPVSTALAELSADVVAVTVVDGSVTYIDPMLDFDV